MPSWPQGVLASQLVWPPTDPSTTPAVQHLRPRVLNVEQVFILVRRAAAGPQLSIDAPGSEARLTTPFTDMMWSMRARPRFQSRTVCM